MHASSSSWAGPLALATAAAFTGAAVYVSAVEHPARLSALDDDAALQQWKPAYKRAAVMQASLAALSAALGVKAATAARGDARFLWGAGLAFASLPYTVAGMLPLNNGLLAAPRGDAATTAKLRTWGKLHVVRVALGAVATAAYACGLAEPAAAA